MSTIHNIKTEVDIQRLPVDSEEHKFNDWMVKYKKSHILHSQCSTADRCSTSSEKCQFCVYTSTLELPHLPEMVFPNNILYLIHSSGAGIEFNALDALKQVCNKSLPIKVACSDAWRGTRSPSHLEEKVKPFDWTFSSDYRGTVSGPFDITTTDERINIEKLKEREKILFYQDLMLYEDELHDNGIASCTVKIRVMPSSFFVLLRYFLRVDNVMVRVNDTRLFHEFSTNYILREYTNRESGFQELGLPLPVFADPNLISQHLPLQTSIYEKLVLPNNENVQESSSKEQ
ncbi:TIP41-like protein [Onthophagus taurus]|uniref:TIP41-like protein n=1 Tax=Onthophagus taurus TaxID=166361 RepID=UPI000C204877|nr:TIP41-like protein [Onthophagus taurus]